MKNYKSFMFQNKESREKWIKMYGDNLFKNLNNVQKLMLIILYHQREFNNLSNKLKLLNMTYSAMSRYMQLLYSLGLIEIIPNGREMRYRLTNKGNKFCLDFLEKFNI